MSPSCPACIRLVACPAHRPAARRSHASDTGPSLSTLPLSSQVQHLDPLTSKIGASAPTPLISFSSSKSTGLKAPIISARAKAKHADAAARASHGPLSKRQKKRLKKASHARGRKSANDVWIYFRSTNAARTPVGANLEDICTEDSAYQVSQPFSQFQRPKDGKYLRCALCLKTAGLWNTWANRKDGVTGVLRAHLEQEHGPTYHAKCEAEGVVPRALKPNFDSDDEEFTPEGLRDRIARWTAIDDQAIRAVERQEFIRLLVYCSRARTALRRRDIPRRKRVMQAMHELYLAEKTRIIDDMKSAKGLISITSDLWSDINIRSFMAVTAHFINAEGVLAEHLIAFRRLTGNHTGANIGRHLFSVFEENGITNKIGFVTLDNASNNDTLMVELEDAFREHNIETFGHEANRIRCFPHVINLAVRALLDSLPDAAKYYRDVAVAQDIPIDAQVEEYLQALESKPVDGCRNLVNAMRKSDSRREGLQDSIQYGNSHDLFVNELGVLIEVPVLQLLRDSETRWSSTYNMICRFLQLNPAIMHYSAKNAALKLPLLSRQQLEVLRDISSILRVLNNAQELLSAERTPTLSLALPVYETLIHTLANLRPEFPELSYSITRAINKLEHYVNKTHHIPVYALSMVINPCFKLQWIDAHWDSSAREQAYSIVREQMLRYHRKHPSGVALDVLASANAAAQALGSGFARLLTGGLTITRASNPSANPANNPYISSPPPPLFNPIPTTSLPQDPMIAVESELARWMRRFEFPLLYCIAMDVLPAQASSVSCERAFSASKLTITRERNLILPENLEMLQFLKHSLHRRHGSSGLETLPLDFMARIVCPDLDAETDSDSEHEESDTEYESD